jgi:hypothetical protein
LLWIENLILIKENEHIPTKKFKMSDDFFKINLHYTLKSLT